LFESAAHRSARLQAALFQRKEFPYLTERESQPLHPANEAERYDVAGYLDYQGKGFTRRFDANSYLVLSKAMDNFDLARGYESEEAALRRIQARTLLVGISSDWLFPATDILELTRRMQSAGRDQHCGRKKRRRPSGC